MVCPRCISAVDKVFNDINLKPLEVKLGEVTIPKKLNSKQFVLLKQKLEFLGFELLDDGKRQQIEKIKSIVINHIHHIEDGKFAFPDIISKDLNKEYSQLSKLFSLTEGITIEQFVILQKIEKVKELIMYNQMNLSEIADKMGYSSVAHLSSQFKKTIGLTPSQFKTQGLPLRKTLDTI
ncbi:MAG: AraC family transcriptional regulator [Bacteroidota bacterium]|nr:AraC family transcriptional regulator [Bacteroidota bacterium]